VARWRRFLAETVRAARPDAVADEIDDVVTTLVGISMATNQEVQLLGLASAGDRGRRAMHRITGVGEA
jgi:hypothetical protein